MGCSSSSFAKDHIALEERVTLVCVVGSWDKGAAGHKARPTQAGFRREKPSLGKAEEQKVRLREADI